MSGAVQQGVLDHFQVSLLTQGSGTQIFSTTFVQWAAAKPFDARNPTHCLRGSRRDNVNGQ